MPATVLVAGALASKNGNGGEAWVRLSYLLGLQRLDVDVAFVEEVGTVCGEGVEYFRRTVAAFGVAKAALVDGRGEIVVGALPPRADLLVNISGNLRRERLLERAERRAYVDIDPGYTQFWAAEGLLDLGDHTVHFTVGENVGSPSCPIPTNGVRWRPTRPPVVLERWTPAYGSLDRFTTVGSWRGPYGRVDYGGRRYGLKLDEFRKLMELPKRVPHKFELALDIDEAERRDLERLQEHGWRLVAPRAVAADPESFRDYVRRSGAEFSVAQGIYVETNSGWFSDRTTRYLASGKPALVQDTGFSANIPVGRGLIAFRSLAEAVAGVDAIAADYDGHARAARALAEEYFDSDRVLTGLLEEALA